MTPDDLERFLSENLKIERVRRSGQNLLALCPNHPESRPSWGMRTDEPHLHACFSCGYKGTLRTLLLDKGWSLAQVTNLLGKYTLPNKGLSFGYIDQPTGPQPQEEDIWPFVLEPPALKYMVKRGVALPTLKVAKVVYHPLDRRVLFPWYWHGKFLGATGRTIEANNPVKVEAYCSLQKRTSLYCPAGALSRTTPLVLVEGEIDALKVYQAGFKNVVALGHGRFSQEQSELLQTLPVNFEFVLFFDCDAVGSRLFNEVRLRLTKMGFQQIRLVDWSLLRCNGKNDPGALTVPQLRMLVKAARKTLSWSILNA